MYNKIEEAFKLRLTRTDYDHKGLLDLLREELKNLPKYPVVFCSEEFYRYLKYWAGDDFYAKILYLDRVGKIDINILKNIEEFLFFGDFIFVLDEKKDIEDGFAFLWHYDEKIFLTMG